ncbi:uncharacterized protein LOC108676872 [Hyalella azteca]|uniref:Uncharacterized protein LOC108676872 n=1 Tax=Hyalella azteca TaxID=294128 RepID=A0A8B7P322_HYAAZ|nr:uncharacterized protein LOC108676872 [Hyalella azteca]
MESYLFLGLLLLGVAEPMSLPETRIFEGELTQLLIQFLSPLDPATLQEAQLAMSNEKLIDVQLVLYEGQCRGFSAVQVTLFEPPLPFISNKLKLSIGMSSVVITAKRYNMTGSFFGSPVQGSGAANLTFADLVLDVTFETEEFSSDPLRVCLRYNSFNINLSASSITGNFEGMEQVNSNMDKAGPFILEELQKNINKKGPEIEDAINNQLCST